MLDCSSYTLNGMTIVATQPPLPFTTWPQLSLVWMHAASHSSQVGLGRDSIRRRSLSPGNLHSESICSVDGGSSGHAHTCRCCCKTELESPAHHRPHLQTFCGHDTASQFSKSVQLLALPRRSAVPFLHMLHRRSHVCNVAAHLC